MEGDTNMNLPDLWAGKAEVEMVKGEYQAFKLLILLRNQLVSFSVWASSRSDQVSSLPPPSAMYK